MKWRVIDRDKTCSEAFHQALEQVLMEKMQKRSMRPTLRFWYRENPGIPIGRFQAFENEVNRRYVEKNNIDVVRRVTGGGAMFCEPGSVITYSIYIPEEQVPGEVEKSYRQLDSFAVRALNELGVDARYQPLNDIECTHGKLGGAAQLKRGGAVLHHTTLSYDLNTEKMLRTLKIGEEKVSDKAVESTDKRVSRISDHINHGRQQVTRKLIEEFGKQHELERTGLRQSEIEKAEELADQKFSTREWNRKI